MGDTVCTNCRGATTGGCEICRPGLTNQHAVIGDLASEMAALKLENERLKAAIEYHEEAAGEARGEAHQAKQRIANLQVHNAQLESRIDWLMLEYCPEEMTEEQKQRWADSQEPAGGKGDG